MSYSEKAGWKEFLEFCQQADSAKTLDKILRLYLTPEEQQAIAMRYLIVRELLAGEQTQREMAKNLQVSIAKITRGSNMVKLMDDELKTLLKENAHV